MKNKRLIYLLLTMQMISFIWWLINFIILFALGVTLANIPPPINILFPTSAASIWFMLLIFLPFLGNYPVLLDFFPSLSFDFIIMAFSISIFIWQLCISIISFWIYNSTKKRFYMTMFAFSICSIFWGYTGIFFLLAVRFQKKLKQDLNLIYKPALLPYKEDNLSNCTFGLWIYLVIYPLMTVWFFSSFSNQEPADYNSFPIGLMIYLAFPLTPLGVSAIFINVISKIRYFKANKTNLTKWFWIDLFLLSQWNYKKYSVNNQNWSK